MLLKKDKRRSGGSYWACRVQRRDQGQRYRDRYRERNLARKRAYAAKRWREDGKHRERVTGYVRQWHRRKYQEEPEYRARILSNTRRWRKNHQERVRELRHKDRQRRRGATPGSPYTRRQVFERDGGRCYLCGVALEPGWHVEHVIPISKGGLDGFENVRASCRDCNLGKGAR